MEPKTADFIGGKLTPIEPDVPSIADERGLKSSLQGGLDPTLELKWAVYFGESGRAGSPNASESIRRHYVFDRRAPRKYYKPFAYTPLQTSVGRIQQLRERWSEKLPTLLELT